MKEASSTVCLASLRKRRQAILRPWEVMGRAQKRTWSSNGPVRSSNHKATLLPLPLLGGWAWKGKCCLRWGLNGDLPFTVQVALSREAQTPQLSIAGESLLSCAGPLICFNNDSWIIWPLNVCCQRDLYCGCDDGYLLEAIAWCMSLTVLFQWNIPVHLEISLLPTLSLHSVIMYCARN